MRNVLSMIDRNLFFSRLGGIIRKSRGKELPLITISREYGSGGSTVARLVAKRMGRPWKLYHEEIVSGIAKESKLERALINEIDESKTPLIEEVIHDFFGRRYMNLSSYYKHLVKILSAIGNRGYAVILGRGANFLFPNALKVRIIGEMSERVRWLIKYESMTEKRAIKTIEESDQKRHEFARTIFNHDPRKAHHYDLLIRTSDRIDVNTATDIIVTLARRRFKL